MNNVLNNEKLFEALGKIADELLTEAYEVSDRQKLNVYKKAERLKKKTSKKRDPALILLIVSMAVLAAAVIIFGCSKLFGGSNGGSGSEPPSSNVSNSVMAPNTSSDEDDQSSKEETVKELVIVPDVEGLTLSKATELLTRAGLTVTTDLESSDTVLEGSVIRQSIPAGDKAEKGTAVTVTLSAGKSNSVGNTNHNNLNRNHVILQGEWIYFTNVAKDFSLYRMRTYSSECQKLIDECVWFNVLGEWIYYSSYGSDLGICKMKLDGSQKTVLGGVASEWLFVTEDWIYYSESLNSAPIYRMKHDGSSQMQVCSENCRYANVVGDYIYYIDEAQTGIYRTKTDGTLRQQQVVEYHNLTDLYYDNGRLYATHGIKDILVFEENGSRVGRYTPTADQVSLYSVQEGWMYYLKFDFKNNENMQICRAKPDFSEEKVIYDFKELTPLVNFFLQYENGWVYFPNTSKDGELYRVNVALGTLEDMSQ